MKPMMANEWNYKVKEAADCMVRCEEHKKDKKLMAAVREELKKRLAATQAAAKKT